MSYARDVHKNACRSSCPMKSSHVIKDLHPFSTFNSCLPPSNYFCLQKQHITCAISFLAGIAVMCVNLAMTMRMCLRMSCVLAVIRDITYSCF
jgi:hypothetical protein